MKIINKLNKITLLFFFLIFLYIVSIIYLFSTYYKKNIQNIQNEHNIERFSSLEEGIASLFNTSYKKITNSSNSINQVNTIKIIKTNSDNNKVLYQTNINENIKKETRYIYIIPVNNRKFLFYNKNKQNYLYLINNLDKKEDDNFNKIQLFNINNESVGHLINETSSKFIFKINLFSEDNYINIHFYNNYLESKIFIDNDSKEFYIKQILNQPFNKYNIKMNKEYEIYEFSKKIGKINYNGKVLVYDEFKNYLNIFGLTYILFNIIDNEK